MHPQISQMARLTAAAVALRVEGVALASISAQSADNAHLLAWGKGEHGMHPQTSQMACL